MGCDARVVTPTLYEEGVGRVMDQRCRSNCIFLYNLRAGQNGSKDLATAKEFDYALCFFGIETARGIRGTPAIQYAAPSGVGRERSTPWLRSTLKDC